MLMGFYNIGFKGGGNVDLTNYYDKTQVDNALTNNVNGDHLGTWQGKTPDQVGRKVIGVHHVEDYANLAVNVGQATEDWQPAIQACIDNAANYRTSGSKTANSVAKVMFGLKRYKIRNPILIPVQGIILEGVSFSAFMPDNEYVYGFGADDINCTVIEKTTSTNTLYASKTRVTRDGNITTLFNVDAIIMLDHQDENWNYNTTISNMFLRSRTATGYGIYAPRAAHLTIDNVKIYKAQTGYFTYDTWMSQFHRVHVRDAQTGFKFVYDNRGAAGTTCNFVNCFADTCSVAGFDLQTLHYSSMINCAADHCTGSLYRFYGCDAMTMIGCGAEDVRANSDIIVLENNTLITVNGFSTYAIAANTSGSHAPINCLSNGIRAVFNGCKFQNYATSETSFTKAYIVAQSCNIEFHSCQLPTNVGTGTVGASSIVHLWDNTGYKQTTSSGTKTATMT